MASLPSLALPGLRRTTSPHVAAASVDTAHTLLAATDDPKLTIARRMRQSDLARRATSVAPPSGR